ncbi:MAG: NAD(P)-dependent alcohol dehydrogenase [Gemmatimonadetes bacterium]|nr:NAD(P)-dependent alcohol dehydrogenase [Gemmatimonadota bacterium]
MRAVTYERYGSPDVLRIQELEKPTPKAGEVLIAVHAASANAADWHLLRGQPLLIRVQSGFRKPKNGRLGADVAGRVEAVGRDVTRFRPGDEVMGDVSGHGFGAFADYVSVPEGILVSKPENLSFEQAAAVPLAAVTALQGLRTKGGLRSGQKVLINGASGGVGTFAVQIAKALGAEVTAVCSTANVALMRSIGADHVIDYTREDFAAGGHRYDLILAANGNRSISDYRRALSQNGTYVMTGGAMAQMTQAMLLGPWISMTSGKKMGNLLARPNLEDLTFITDLIAVGDVVPIIDRRYPLEEVAAAIRYLEEGHARGKVVIGVTHDTQA